QVVEAEAATATASQRPRTTPRPINEAIIEEIDEESEEELYDSDLDELALIAAYAMSPLTPRLTLAVAASASTTCDHNVSRGVTGNMA
ncbi:hypothetical protein V498_04592, partial [Pseudogymnoascus sp. VKM F-4517 (FW-2822)]